METEETIESTLESIEGPRRIGKGTSTNYSSITLKTYLPLQATVVYVRAYIRNLHWQQGQCALGSTHWVQAKLNGEEPMGWCKAKSEGQGTTEHARWVKVRFWSWSHCNSREAKLVVGYRMPGESELAELEVQELEDSLWQEASLGYIEN